MDFMELSRDTTKFRREFQYLSGARQVVRALAVAKVVCPELASHSPGLSAVTTLCSLLNPEGPHLQMRLSFSPGLQTRHLGLSPGPWGQQRYYLPH